FYFRAEEIDGNLSIHGFQAEVDATKDVGGLYETGGRGWVVQPKPEDVAKWFRADEWNDMSVSAHGKRVIVHVNGKKSAEVVDDPGRLSGRFALQLHGSEDVEVWWRDIEILVPAKAAEAASRAE